MQFFIVELIGTHKDERIKGNHLKVKNDITKIKSSIDSGDKAT
jgi:hypothetical protein